MLINHLGFCNHGLVTAIAILNIKQKANIPKQYSHNDHVTISVATEAFVKETLNDLISSLGVERSQLFTSDETKMFFRERSQTDKFAEECATKVNSLGSEAFNPLTGI